MSWPPCLLLLLYCFPGFMSIDAAKQEFGTVQDLPASPSVLHSVIASQFRKDIPRRQIATLSPASPSIIYSIPVVRMSRNSSALTTRPSILWTRLVFRHAFRPYAVGTRFASLSAASPQSPAFSHPVPVRQRISTCQSHISNPPLLAGPLCCV